MLSMLSRHLTMYSVLTLASFAPNPNHFQTLNLTLGSAYYVLVQIWFKNPWQEMSLEEMSSSSSKTMSARHVSKDMSDMLERHVAT